MCSPPVLIVLLFLWCHISLLFLLLPLSLVTTAAVIHHLPCSTVVDGFFVLFFNFYLFIYFGAVLGLPCCEWAFSSCGEWLGATLCPGMWASHCDSFSCCPEQAPGCTGFSSYHAGAQYLRFRDPEHRLSSCNVDLDASQHVRSSWTRDAIRVFYSGKRILYHWATREAQIGFW